MNKSAFLSGRKFLIFIAAAIGIILLLRLAGAAVKGDVRVESQEDIIEFLNGYGWQVNPQPTNVKSVEIPKNFSAVYNNYNALQKKQGFDLSKHKGKTAQSYTFEVLNFNDMPGVYANILVIDKKIAGGDICSYALDGFMTGFDGTTTA